MVYPVRAMVSSARTVAEYLRELPPERRAVVAAVRRLVRKHLPSGYEETMNWGMVTYQVPRKMFQGTSNGQPKCYAALAAQKNYYALYLMSLYLDRQELEAFRTSFQAAGKKLDAGKSCVRFRRLDDLVLPAVARLVAATPVEQLVATFEKAHARTEGQVGRAGKAGRAGGAAKNRKAKR